MERQLQLKTQQQFTKEYMEAKGLKEEQEAGQSQGPGPGPGSTTCAPGLLPTAAGAQVHTSSDTDEDANKDGEQEEQPGEEGDEVSYYDLSFNSSNTVYRPLRLDSVSAVS